MNVVFLEARRGHESPGATVTWCRELNSGPLIHHAVSLTPVISNF